MQKTSYQCQQFAIEIETIVKREHLNATFKDCLETARHYYDQTRKPVNSTGAHSHNRTEFILNLLGAHFRHTGTNYDLYFKNGYTKDEARAAVRESMGEIIHNWNPY